MKGKGIYIWKIKECEDGNIPNIVTMCVNAGFSHVIIKIADGTSGYNFTQEDGDMAKELADALKVAGIEPWGWQFVYGNDPVGEARAAIRRIEETGVEGFVINAESAYKDKHYEAIEYTNMLSQLNIPIALSSFRYPEVHPELPWQAFLSVCDLVMPQVYWKKAHNPAEQLRECLRQYAKITDLPILPTGSAYCADGWCPTNEEIKEFATEAEAQGLPGINFWEWNSTRADGFWKTVRDIEYMLEQPPVDCCEELRAELMEAWIEWRATNTGMVDNMLDIKELSVDIGAVLQCTQTNAAEIEKATEAYHVWFTKNEDDIAKLTIDLGVLRARELAHTREHEEAIAALNDKLDKLGNAWVNTQSDVMRIDADISELKLKTIPETNHSHWWQRLFGG